MMKIGLTGGIGSGKTTVARIFEILGIPVYYADDAARRLMNTDPDLKRKIINLFGEQAYNHGLLDRNYISSQVFENKNKLGELNALTHPVTIKDADDWMKNQETPYAIKEAALIFESGAEKMLDLVIGVDAPEEIRIRRTMERDSVSRDQVIARMKNQLPDGEKMSRCDFLIHNDDTQAILPQVLVLHQKLLGLSETRNGKNAAK
ncbi:MAG: dephospho-CoA kinase [Chitinophagales bacterium]